VLVIDNCLASFEVQKFSRVFLRLPTTSKGPHLSGVPTWQG